MVKLSDTELAREPEGEVADTAPSITRRKVPAKRTTTKRSQSRSDYVQIFRKAETALGSWKPLSKATPQARYQVIDFFSGCGGVSLGFAALGKVTKSIEVVGGCDIDPVAANTFEANFGVPCVVADIAEVSQSKTRIKGLLEQYPRYDPSRETILIGCAPCQGFSSHRKKSWDKPDPRNSLPARFALIAKEINPVCVVMENVPEMLSTKYWDEFSAAKRILEEAGYIVKQSIYNAATFGVAQERFRAVVIAMKRDFVLPLPPLTDHSQFRTVRDAIGHLPAVAAGERTYADSLHYSASHKPSTMTTIRAVPPNGGSRPIGVGPACLDRIKGFSDVYGRLYWERPSITITHYARNPASGRFVHPEQHRGLTIRECAQLQSFPPGFTFTGQSDGIYRQIGEAVPPLLSLGVAAHVLNELSLDPPTADEIQQSPASIETPVSSSYSSVIAGIKSSRSKK
ncbi:DNA cytosine methyltransferase [Noviherbaspirillum sp. UKPF54]|uniref:DNA cytosine methyltransferase n=1 Tax=Noviherbaspirillum sp. UKPF54 TaxID=2601898 RepID=UPI0011B122BA|nr:DNA cytosine methyltransferase [Noviherbaspirillum sp. UKPF54]QDZ29570.1 DNA cytosine methyltransferase [Noviherbaspirillum sp. UKPF54]